MAMLCAATGASAQPVHEQGEAGGQTLSADRTDASPPPPTKAVPKADGAKAPARNSKISSRLAARIEAGEAARRLAQARLARARGAAPLPHELARGMDAQAVNLRYWQRQEKLRHEVEQALRRSNETHRSVLASR